MAGGAIGETKTEGAGAVVAGADEEEDEAEEEEFEGARTCAGVIGLMGA
jgi:hypothetical protein